MRSLRLVLGISFKVLFFIIVSLESVIIGDEKLFPYKYWQEVAKTLYKNDSEAYQNFLVDKYTKWEKLNTVREEAELERYKNRIKDETDDSVSTNIRGEESLGVTGLGRTIRLPKLEPYKGEESIDQFVQAFERYAVAVGWDTNHWATALGSLLQGEARAVYLKVPLADCNNYNILKNELFRYFKCTAEGYKIKFRKIRPIVTRLFFENATS